MRSAAIRMFGVPWGVIGPAVFALVLLACGADTAVNSSVPPSPAVTSDLPVGNSPSPIALPGAVATLAPSPSPAATPFTNTAGVVVVANEMDQSLSFIDAASNQVMKTVGLNFPPKSITLDPDGHTAWVFSSRPGESDVYLFDVRRGEPLGARRLRGAPSAIAFLADASRAFIARREDNSISFLSPIHDEIWELVLGRQTEGVGIRRQLSALLLVPSPSSVGSSGHSEVLYVAGEGAGAIWAVDPGSGQLLAEIEIGGGPIRLLHAQMSRMSGMSTMVYVLTNTINAIVGVDPVTRRVVNRTNLPGWPADAAVGADGRIYVTARDGSEVWAVDPATSAIAARIKVGAGPSGIALSPDGRRAYVANRGDGTLSVIDVLGGRVVATVRVGNQPVGVAFAPPSDQSSIPTPIATGQPGPSPTLVTTPALVVTPRPAGATPEMHPAPNTVTEVFVPDANVPTAMAFAPDGRLFYGEYRTGKIRIVENGVLLPEPLWDFTVSGQPEAGLVGLTLDPNFARNHYVYAFYTAVPDGDTREGGPAGPNHVVRLTEVNGKGTNLRPILSNLPSGPLHNAGSLRFGPDGKLYVPIGDTGDLGKAQDLQSRVGKILRVNPDGSIPADNPFVGQADKDPAIWAYGFRNPFDLDFHPINGVLISDENGPGDNDELNLIVEGGNYGWPPAGYQDKPGIVNPLFVFNPPASPVGVAFYRGDQIPEWKNDLFYCAFHLMQLRRVRLAPESYDRVVFEEVVASGCTIDVVSGPDGALYYSDLDAIYRIRRADAPGLRPVPPLPTPVPNGTPSRVPDSSPQEQDLGVNLVEWKIVMSRSVVQAGKLRILAENLGLTVHSLRITGNGVDQHTDDFPPGQSRLLEVDLAPGTYVLTCPVTGHTENGMTATLTVQ